MVCLVHHPGTSYIAVIDGGPDVGVPAWKDDAAGLGVPVDRWVDQEVSMIYSQFPVDEEDTGESKGGTGWPHPVIHDAGSTGVSKG